MEHNKERLTWKEIKEKYPNQWVGLTDVERDGSDIVSAVVKYTGKTEDFLIQKQFIERDGTIKCHTNPNYCGFDVGIIT